MLVCGIKRSLSDSNLKPLILHATWRYLSGRVTITPHNFNHLVKKRFWRYLDYYFLCISWNQQAFTPKSHIDHKRIQVIQCEALNFYYECGVIGNNIDCPSCSKAKAPTPFGTLNSFQPNSSNPSLPPKTIQETYSTPYGLWRTVTYRKRFYWRPNPIRAKDKTHIAGSFHSMDLVKELALKSLP